MLAICVGGGRKQSLNLLLFWGAHFDLSKIPYMICLFLPLRVHPSYANHIYLPRTTNTAGSQHTGNRGSHNTMETF